MAHLKMICLFTMICPWKNNIFWVLQALLDYQRINNQWAPMQPMHNARQIALSTASAPHLPVVALVAALVFITWWWDNGAEIVEYPRAGVPIRWKNRKVTNRHPKISLIWHKYGWTTKNTQSCQEIGNEHHPCVFLNIDCHACVPISPNLEFDFASNRGRETTTIGMCKICDRVSLNEAAKHGKTTSSTSLFKCPTNNHEMPWAINHHHPSPGLGILQLLLLHLRLLLNLWLLF